MQLDQHLLDDAFFEELQSGTYRFLPQLVRHQSRPGVLDLRFRTNKATLYLGQDAAANLNSGGGFYSIKGPAARALTRISPEGRVQADYCSSLDRAVIATQAAFSFPSKQVQQATLAAWKGTYQRVARRV